MPECAKRSRVRSGTQKDVRCVLEASRLSLEFNEQITGNVEREMIPPTPYRLFSIAPA
jgi:hypothetical protein